MDEAGRLEDPDVHRGRRRRDIEVSPDLIDRDDAITEVSQDLQAWLAPKGLQHLKGSAIGPRGIDVGAAPQHAALVGHDNNPAKAASLHRLGQHTTPVVTVPQPLDPMKYLFQYHTGLSRVTEPGASCRLGRSHAP